MAATSEISALGLPVEMRQIGRELKKLWSDEEEGAKTRASLINLAIYSEEKDSLARNTELIARIAEKYACRAIVIGADPKATRAKVESWINAHCHLRSGRKQVCSEQISFRLAGHSTDALPAILFSQLDSDLPLYLWWQNEFRAPIDSQLWSGVDRLIFDSKDWHDFNAQMELIDAAQRNSQRRIVLCDLNWTRLVFFRLAFAQFFDHPASHHHFEKIESVAIEFRKDFRTTALLLVGWLAAQLGWELTSSRQSKSVNLKNRAGNKVEVELQEKAKSALSAFAVRSREMEFSVKCAACEDLLEVCRAAPGAKRNHQLLPAGEDDLATLLTEELTRGGPHQIYLRAVQKVRALL